MCVGVPARVVEILDGGHGVVELEGVLKRVCLALLPDVSNGDYVILHAGFAIQHLDEEEAAETLRIVRELVSHEG